MEETVTGLRRADHEDASGCLLTFDPAVEAVVLVVTILQSIEIVRVVGVALAHERHELVRLLLVASGLGEHDDVFACAGEHRVEKRYAVGGAAIEEKLAVRLDDLAYERHRRRCDEIGQVIVVIVHLVVVGFAGFKVG